MHPASIRSERHSISCVRDDLRSRRHLAASMSGRTFRRVHQNTSPSNAWPNCRCGHSKPAPQSLRLGILDLFFFVLSFEYRIGKSCMHDTGAETALQSAVNDPMQAGRALMPHFLVRGLPMRATLLATNVASDERLASRHEPRQFRAYIA
jgi:hypothetical protein